MRTIRIDDDVFACLQREATPLVDTPNAVLRRILGLEAKSPAPPRAGLQGELLPLLNQGKLKAGDELVWDRPRKRKTYRAVVTATGCIKLPDGHVATSPSAACHHLADGAFNGWREWHTVSGIQINDLRK